MLGVLGAMVLLLTLCMETLARRQMLPQWLSRKILHIGAVGACAVAPLWVKDIGLLIVVVTPATVALLFLVAKGYLFRGDDGRRSWGIALFPVAYLVLLVFFPENRRLIVIPMAILAICDAAAAFAGQTLARSYVNLTGDQKSLTGSTAFALSAFALLTAFQIGAAPELHPFPETPFLLLIPVILFISLLLAATEAMGSSGFDNLWVPFAALFLLWKVPVISPETNLSLLLALPLALLFVWFTLRRRSLSPDGAVMAVITGFWILYFAGAQWLLPLFFFFLSSSALSRLHRSKTAAADAKHSAARDYRQVLCNGGVYAALGTLSGEMHTLYICMAVSLATSTADTWASEIGIYFRGKTWDILRLRPAPVGLSGGVSLQGTLGGLMGAGAVALLCYVLLPERPSLSVIAFVTLAGFCGMLLDSIIGAGLQARFRSKEGTLSDTAQPQSSLDSGFVWLGNDGVNILSNVIATALSAYVLQFLP